MNEDEDEIRIPSTLPAAPTPSVSSSLIEMPLTTSASHSETLSGTATSADLTSAFPDFDTSSAILAPTLRMRTRNKGTVNTATATTTNIEMDSEGDSSSLFDSYMYTYPYLSSHQNGQTEAGSSSVSTSSTSGLTPPIWSPSESVPGSRSRSLSSTHTSSFGSEESSGHSFLVLDDGGDEGQDGDDDIQHLPQILMMPAEDKMDTVIHPEVSLLGPPGHEPEAEK